MNKLIQYLGKHKDNIVRRELARAHLMIALLSLVIIVWLVIGRGQTITFDPVFTIVAAILLLIVIAISLTMSYILFSYRRK